MPEPYGCDVRDNYALANSKSLIWDGFVLNYCQPTADCREILGFSFYTLEAILQTN